MNKVVYETIDYLYGINPHHAIRVRSHDILCPHVESEPLYEEGGVIPNKCTVSTSHIRLRKQMDNKGRVVGWFGKCPVCGKIYYS